MNKNLLPRASSIACDFLVERAKNAEFWTSDGRRYIDFAGGIGVLNVGHCHPKVVRAVKDQLDKFTHTAFQLSPYQIYFDLAEKVANKVPIDGEKKTCFFSTGAEAVENAVKIARAYTKRTAVISFVNSFHGRTMMTLALTGKVEPYKRDFGAMQTGVFHALYPSETQGVTTADAIKSLQRIFKVDIAPTDVAAIILEPIQGEGGFNVAPQDFMYELRTICDQHGIVLIADEVQSGFCRSGEFFAMHHFKEQVDIITMAKSLAGGMVLSGVCGKAKVMDATAPGGLGGTYAGNPLSIAAALAVMDIIEEENLIQRSKDLGTKLTKFLTDLNAPETTQIRGLGSMVAIEFGDEANPLSDFTKKVHQIALQKGLLVLTCGAYGNVIRFLYPLTIEDNIFDEGLAILAQAITEARG